ncbi:uncharacterized protein LOC105704333 [Orussus abietinus]|uniref:uncharacterized protein LOC105704333 n=1 Tax=Orussus abietinus TaxID=222816 RepID=UPI000C715D99|nr:uncharacterized protein LOC105704333 [Orussus abietinus]
MPFGTIPNIIRPSCRYKNERRQRRHLEKSSLSTLIKFLDVFHFTLRLPVSRRQLAASVSLTTLEPGKCGAMGAATRGRVILFWTPEYWYRPRAAATAYKELRQHLALLRDFRVEKERLGRKRFFCRRKRSVQSEESWSVEERSSCILGRLFSSGGTARSRRNPRERKEGSTTAQLRRLLRMDLVVTIWDIDSTTLARQLTLIDRDLFLRIPSLEVEVLIFQKSSRNAPNLGAWVAFSHRISCLMASELLAIRRIDMRTRMLARIVNAADKCHLMGNFHSCRSILAGLQSPPVFRLRATWSRLRKNHASTYETMERLCKIYRSTRTKNYHKAWEKAERNGTSMPYVGDLLGRVLGLDEEKSTGQTWRISESICRGTHASILVLNKSSQTRMQSKFTPRQRNTTLKRPAFDVNPKNNGLAKRIFVAALTKIRHGSLEPPISSSGHGNLIFTARERYLARMASRRWRNFIFMAKIRAENEARIRNMEPRKRRVLDVVSWLTECQKSAQKYNFPGHSLAWEFLLKARYKEDKENFFLSFKLEPPGST